MTGILTKRVPAIGAKAVMIGGVALYLISLIFLEPHFRETAVSAAQAEGISDMAQLSIIKAEAYPHYLHVMGILFVFNIVVMLIFGWLKPKKEIAVEETTDAIEITPWKYAIAIGVFITLLVVSTYFIFT